MYIPRRKCSVSSFRKKPLDKVIQIPGKIKCGESVQHFETLRQTKEGGLINVSVTASQIKDTTGKPIGGSNSF